MAKNPNPPVKTADSVWNPTDWLPEGPTDPARDLSGSIIEVYGPPKIGKSSFCAQFPGAVFVPTEPGLRWIRHEQIPPDPDNAGRICANWADVGRALLALQTDAAQERYKNVIIDTVDNMWVLCERWYAAKEGIDSPSDMGYGKGTAAVTAEFRRALMKFAELPYGLILTSHAETRDYQHGADDSSKWSKVVPTLPDRARKIVNGLVDLILLYSIGDVPITDAEGRTKIVERRVIECRQSKKFDAGGRTNTLPARLVVGNTPGAAYEQLMAAHEEGLAKLDRGESWDTGPAAVPVFADERRAFNREQK